MRSQQPDQAYRSVEETLTVAARQTGANALGDDAYWTLGSLRRLLTSLDAAQDDRCLFLEDGLPRARHTTDPG